MAWNLDSIWHLVLWKERKKKRSDEEGHYTELEVGASGSLGIAKIEKKLSIRVG